MMGVNVRHLWPLHLSLLLTEWLPDNVAFMRFRGWLASFFLGSCAGRLTLGRGVTFYNPQNIHLGEDVYIARGGWFNGSERITIEDEVMFGPYCVVAASNHTLKDGSYRRGVPDRRPIRIGRGAWIAAHCSITAGVTIGRGALVAASSAVAHDVADGGVVGGVPARPIGRR